MRLRLGPGWRYKVHLFRLEKSTAKRPKSVKSSMATAHSQAAEAERSGQVWRTTTLYQVKGTPPANHPEALLGCPVTVGR